ncbi:hypothetical protein B0H14DRAFT_3127089 [Mycena olivaceomarginata]|nr:hypothetical protein B0H14DRAFT_3127089 [Mycena olivaceomarginata]
MYKAISIHARTCLELPTWNALVISTVRLQSTIGRKQNQLGPHVRQLNLGHRQDTIINHHGDWNYKKTMKIVWQCEHRSSVNRGVGAAKKKYLEKRNHYIALSISFKDRVAQWQKMPRTTYKEGKEADDNFASTPVPKSKIAEFLDHHLSPSVSLPHLVRQEWEIWDLAPHWNQKLIYEKKWAALKYNRHPSSSDAFLGPLFGETRRIPVSQDLY